MAGTVGHPVLVSQSFGESHQYRGHLVTGLGLLRRSGANRGFRAGRAGILLGARARPSNCTCANEGRSSQRAAKAACRRKWRYEAASGRKFLSVAGAPAMESCGRVKALCEIGVYGHGMRNLQRFFFAGQPRRSAPVGACGYRALRTAAKSSPNASSAPWAVRRGWSRTRRSYTTSDFTFSACEQSRCSGFASLVAGGSNTA